MNQLYPLRSLLWMLLFISVLTVTIGCSDKGNEVRPFLRPIKVYRIAKDTGGDATPYAGEIKARTETVLSFRVSGKIIARPIEIGDHVLKGTLLAKLDLTDYRLAAQALKAQLAAAKFELNFSKDELTRHRELLRQNVISQPDLDKRKTGYIAARERVIALEAQLTQTVNQVNYSELKAERNGRITAVHAEIGQLVTVGQPILSLTKLDEKEVHLDIPEQIINSLKIGNEVEVSLWNQEDYRFPARIREIAASADPASRTYRVKATLLEEQQDLQLGMSATVWLKTEPSGLLAVPISAVFSTQSEPKQAKVWLVDETKQQVKAIPVKLGSALADDRIAVSGVAPGLLIVSAGVHRLREGQAIRLPDEVSALPVIGSRVNVDKSL